MTLASQEGYASALDVGGGGGDALDIGKTGAGPAPEAAAPATEAAASGEPEAPAAARPNLHDEVKIALLDLGGAPTIDAVQEYVNARPGAYVGRGPVEATLLDMEKTNITRRVGGDKFELVAAARAAIENPEAVIARRALIVGTVLVMVMPDGNTFDDLEGVSALELQGYMHGPEGGIAEGALGPNGFEPKFFPVDVLTLDLEALCEAGVFVRRAPDEEDKVRELDQRRGPVESASAPKDGEDEAEDDEEEGDEDEGDAEASSETTTAATDDRPTCYTFAAGAVVRMISHGARVLVIPSLPVVSDPVREAAVASSADANALISKFEQQAAARLEQERTARLNAERVVARLRTHLATKRLEHLVDEALGPPAAPPERAGARKTFSFTQTVAMNAGEQAIIFNELEAVEKEIAEWEARIEGAKLAASSVKTTAKEKITELKEKKAALFAEKHGSERTYTVEAYSELDTTGEHAVNRIRATSDSRLLKEEVLTPAAALETVAKSEVVAPGAPAPASAVTPAPVVTAAPLPAAPVASTASTGGTPPVLADVAAAEEATAAPKKTKTVLNQAGIRPFVLGVLAAAGEAGQADAGLDGAIASAIGTQESPTFHSLVRLVAGQAVAEKLVERRGDAFVYLMEPRIAELVVEAGENGLLKVDLPSSFADKTGIAMTDAIASHMETVLGAMVLADKVSCGAMPGSLGDVLWPVGQTDPRKLSLKPKADASPTPAPTKGRRSKKAAGDAAKPADAARPSDAGTKKPAPKKAPAKKK